ncbi:MAG: DoxX family membrane protein [Chitinophagales bacterium]
MQLVKKLQTYGDTHHPKWLDIMRIALGLILVWKGYYYISNTDALNQLLLDNKFHLYNYVVIHYVAFAHLIGGILIILGLVTRIAVLAQIPVLLGAIIFVHAKHGLLTPDPEFLLSIIVLVLLAFFFVYGSGPWSMDANFEKHRENWDVEEL